MSSASVSTQEFNDLFKAYQNCKILLSDLKDPENLKLVAEYSKLIAQRMNDLMSEITTSKTY